MCVSIVFTNMCPTKVVLVVFRICCFRTCCSESCGITISKLILSTHAYNCVQDIVCKTLSQAFVSQLFDWMIHWDSDVRNNTSANYQICNNEFENSSMLGTHHFSPSTHQCHGSNEQSYLHAWLTPTRRQLRRKQHT